MDAKSQYQALTERAGVCRLDPRSQVEISGRDRAAFLNGFCTNDIKKLAAGAGCEAFLTNVQGKVTGFVYVFCTAQSLWLDTVGGQAESLIAGLDRYLIREDVQLIDRSRQCSELLLAGPQAAAVWTAAGGADLPQQPLAHVAATLGGAPLSLRRVAFTGPDSFFVSCDAHDHDCVYEALVRGGAVACQEAAVEVARLEAGTPLYGHDITSENLPQEVDRNDTAISFTKGCYLGQETVARLDALGHVNRTLRGLRFAGSQVPPVGAEIRRDNKVLARVTSAVWSYQLDAPLAMAYVRREVHQPGTQLESDYGSVEVVALPIRA